jgi:hypothetical protein
MVGIGFGNCGSRPGVTEIDDGNDRSPDVHHFSLARRPHGNCSAHRRIDVGIAQPDGGLIFQRNRIFQISLCRGHCALCRIRLMGPGHCGTQIRLGRFDQLLLRLNRRLGGL